MRRKRKTEADWAKEFPEDLETREKQPKMDSNISEKVEVALVCQFCAVEIDVNPKKKPWDRIQEHLASARHKKLKENYKKRKDSNRQLTLFEMKFAKGRRKRRLKVLPMILYGLYPILPSASIMLMVLLESCSRNTAQQLAPEDCQP